MASIKRDQPYLLMLSDFSFVIVGEHLTVDEANHRFGEEYCGETDTQNGITEAHHYWLRHEFVGEDNCPDGMEPDEFAEHGRCWILHERTTRPKGVVVKATAVS